MNDTVWQNLHILRNLKLHEKLNTADTVFSVSPPGWWTGVHRRWNGERRNVNIGRLQDQFEIALLRLENEELACMKHRMSGQIHGGLQGLQQMQLTYAEDAQAVSQLIVLTQQIHQRLSNVTTHLETGSSSPAPSAGDEPDADVDDDRQASRPARRRDRLGRAILPPGAASQGNKDSPSSHSSSASESGSPRPRSSRT